MASRTSYCLTSLARLSLTPTSRPLASSVPRFLAPSVTQTRFAAASPKKELSLGKRKAKKHFKVHNKGELKTFALCDAIRYIRAFEVGVPPASVKYELAVKLVAPKQSAIVRNRIRLPHPVRADIRIAVICKENSPQAVEARMLGAVVVGEDSLIQDIKDEKITFNRLICHTDSFDLLTRAKVGKILGPKGLMPSPKLGTVTKDIKGALRELTGAEDYREREGVVRIAIGHIAFTPDQLADNVKTFIEQLKKDLAILEKQVVKTIDEIVLSATHSPGFSLNGAFKPAEIDLEPEQLTGPM